MSLVASLMGGCQSFGGFTTCFPSVTNHSKRGQPAETEALSVSRSRRSKKTKQNKKQRAKTNSRQTQPTCRRNGTACTFERRHLARLRFRQAFLAGVGGQSQRDAAAAQQEANLLTSCVLERQRGREALFFQRWKSLASKLARRAQFGWAGL